MVKRCLFFWSFKSPCLQLWTRIRCMRFPGRPYIPPRLYRSAREICKGKPCCLKCGGDHTAEDCGDNVQAKCCNCSDQHWAAYGGCEVRKRVMEINQVKAVNNTTYADALMRVQRGRDEAEKVNQILISEVGQSEKTNKGLRVDKMKNPTFN